MEIDSGTRQWREMRESARYRDRGLPLSEAGHRMSERIPAEVFPPGEFLADELDARGRTQTEFAEIIRRPVKVVNEVIAGKKAVTIDTTREFAAALGTSSQYWMNLQTSYDLWQTAPSSQTELITRDAWMRDRFPIREMIKLGP